MFNELSYELSDVRTALRALEKRVDTVERLALADTAHSDDSLSPVNRPSVSQAGPVLLRSFYSTDDFIPLPAVAKVEVISNLEQTCDSNTIEFVQSTGSVPTNVDQRNPSENFSEESKAVREGLEVFVGRNLNKLGISFLVIGCALALVYQFQYFTPVFKILSGLIGGALLIWGGEKFEKKDAKMAWYGRALIGGGWALSYFSTFAAHYFDSVRIIESAIADFALLFAVASGAIFHSLKYKSETITGITLTLAFATICLSPATSFSVLACTMLVAALVGLCFKMNWYNLFVYGECVFYAIYLGFILPQIMQGQNAFFGMNSADGNFFTATACSIFCWMAMNVVIFTSKELAVKDRNRLVFASLINCAAFVPAVWGLMSSSHPEMKFGFMLATGFAYLISTMTAGKSVAGGPLSCNRIIGLTLVTMAVPLQLTGDSLNVFLSLEIPLLVWAGLRYDMPSVRIFAGFLACLAGGCVIGPLWSQTLGCRVAAVIACIAYGVTAAIYEDNRSNRDPNRKDRLAFHFYFALSIATALAMLIPSLNGTLISAGFVVACMLTVLIGLKLSDKTLRIAGEIAMLLALPVFVAVISAPGHSPIYFLTIPALLYLAYEHRKIEGSHTFSQVLYKGAAASIFATFLAQRFSYFTLETLLALEALAIFAYGFIMRDNSVKIVAFLACSLLSLKFLLMDINSVALMELFGQTVSMPLLYGVVCSATLLTTALMYLSNRFSSYSGESAVVGFYSHFALAAIVVAAMTQSQVPTHWLSLVLTVQGVSVLALGFKYRMKVLRVSGLLLLGLVIARLLFIELASVDTIYRIMSFICAGVVLLVASFAYARMSNETAITKS